MDLPRTMGAPAENPSDTMKDGYALGAVLKGTALFFAPALGFADEAAGRGSAHSCSSSTMHPDIIGWLSSAILLATLVRQVLRQWRERATEGVSKWLFIGQLTASSGFLLYSFLLNNWVFVFTNAALLLTAIIGQMIYQRNVREQN